MCASQQVQENQVQDKIVQEKQVQEKQVLETADAAVTSTKQPCHACNHRRVAVIKRGVNGMGMEIGEVVPGEFHQRGGEGIRHAGQFGCEPVGFPLVPAG
jgi:hypothetical protein